MYWGYQRAKEFEKLEIIMLGVFVAIIVCKLDIFLFKNRAFNFSADPENGVFEREKVLMKKKINKKNLKILWYHPRLRDYRMPLFQLMLESYNISFLVGKENLNIRNPKIISKQLSQGPGEVYKHISFKDLIILFNGIKNCDIFVTSFLLMNYSFYGIIISKLLNKKVIVWEERWFVKKINFKTSVKNFVFSTLSYFVDAFFVMGEIQKTALNKLGIKSKKIFVANEYTGIDYWESKTRNTIKINFNKKNILFLGRFIPVKGVEYLIDAFSIIENEFKRDDFHLNIVGYGPLEKTLKNRVSTLNLKSISFIEPIFCVEEKAFIFKNSYIAVIPSIVDDKGATDAGPIVTLEYLSAGLPIIGTTSIGSSLNFLQRLNVGKIVPEKSGRRIAEEIISLNKLIIQGKINKKSIRKEFSKINGFNHQYDVFKNAIDFVSQKE